MAVFEFPTGLVKTSQSNSFQGLPGGYGNQLLDSIIPQLQQSSQNMSGNIDNYTDAAYGDYQQQLKSILDTAIPQTVSDLANRGILNSTVASDAISQTQNNAVQQFGNQGYQAAMQNALMKMQMPQMLAQIANLGQVSTTSSSSSDPVAIYQTAANLLQGLM